MLKKDNYFPRVINIITVNRRKVFDLSGISILNLVGNFVNLSYYEQQTLIENLYDWTLALNAMLLKCQSATNSGTAYSRNNWHHPILGWINERIDDG